MPQVPGRRPTSVVPLSDSGPVYAQDTSTLAAFGGAVAQATQRSGAASVENATRAADTLLQMQREDNATAVKQADTAYSEAIREITLGENGYYSSRGKAAEDNFQIAQDAINKARDDIASGLENERQRALFAQASGVRTSNEFSSMGKHVLREREVEMDATSQARKNTAQLDAASAWNDANTINTSEAIIRNENEQLAARKGWSEDQLNFQNQQDVSKLYADAVTAAYQFDPIEGQRLFNLYSGKLDGVTRAGLKQSLRKGVLQAESQQAADRIMLEHSGITAQRQAAKAIKRADVRAETLRLIEEEYAFERSMSAEERARYRFQRELEGDERRSFAEDSAQAIYTESEGMAEALAVARKKHADGEWSSDDLNAVEARLTELYQRDRVAAANDATLDAPDMALEISSASKNEQEALDSAAELIDDPTLRIAVQDQIRTLYSDRERQRREDLPEQAQEAADAIRAMEDLDEPAELAFAREQYNGELEQVVVQLLRQRHAEDAEQLKRRKREAAASAFSAVWAGATVAEWQQANPGDFSTIAEDGSIISSLMAAQRLTAQGKLFADTTDGKTLADLRQMETKELAEVNLDEYRSKLTQSEFSQAAALVAGAQSSFSSAVTNQQIYATAQAVMRQFSPKSMKWGAANQSSENRDLQRQATNNMNLRIDAYIKENGKVPERTQLDSWAQEMFVMEFSTPSSWIPGWDTETFGTDARAWSEEQKRNARVDYDTIPIVRRRQLEASLKNTGAEVSRENVEALAAATFFGDTDRIEIILDPTRNQSDETE